MLELCSSKFRLEYHRTFLMKQNIYTLRTMPISPNFHQINHTNQLSPADTHPHTLETPFLHQRQAIHHLITTNPASLQTKNPQHKRNTIQDMPMELQLKGTLLPLLLDIQGATKPVDTVHHHPATTLHLSHSPYISTSSNLSIILGQTVALHV